jgi:hypothetical protein
MHFQARGRVNFLDNNKTNKTIVTPQQFIRQKKKKKVGCLFVFDSMPS